MSAPQITPSPASTAPSPALLRALRHALRPLVRLMIAGGVTLPALIEMLKGLLVDVADKEFGLAGKAPTDSRVSLVTGVHRKDVSRLRRVARPCSAGAAGRRRLPPWPLHCSQLERSGSDH